MLSFSISTSSTSAIIAQALGGIEDVEDHLLLGDFELQIGGDGVGELRRLVGADGRDHRLVIQRLLQLDVLLKEGSDALHQLLDLRSDLELDLHRAHGGDKEAVGVVHLDGACPLQAFDQNLDVAVRHLDALHDVADGAHRIDIFGLRLIDARVVLGGEENLAVAVERLFESADARLAADDERASSCAERSPCPGWASWEACADRSCRGSLWIVLILGLGHVNPLRNS